LARVIQIADYVRIGAAVGARHRMQISRFGAASAPFLPGAGDRL